MNDAGTGALRLAVRTLGAGPRVVLIHGGMGSSNHWIRNVEALATHFTVHAIDLPGYGDSPGIAKSVAREHYIDRVVESLETTVCGEDFALAGFSFGAVVAAMTAARLGHRVRKLSLLGAAGFGPSAKIDLRPIPPAAAGTSARREAFRYNLGILMIADPAAIGEEAIDLYAANFARTRYDGRRHSASDAMVRALEHIACPLQVIYGEQDSVAHADLERRRALLLRRHPNAQFVVLPGGHWIQYEAAAAVNRCLVDFFRR